MNIGEKPVSDIKQLSKCREIQNSKIYNEGTKNKAVLLGCESYWVEQ